MLRVERVPEISKVALALLQVAHEDDAHRAIAKNATLIATLEFGFDLIRVCHQRNLHALFSQLETPISPQSFLAITVASLSRIRDRADKHLSGSRKAPAVGDYNRPVLQGFALALADLAWPERAAKDFDGPSPEEFLSRIAQYDLGALWLATFQHYVANILQEYFAALPQRTQEIIRKRDPDTEVNLRLSDAFVVAEYAIALAKDMGEETSPAIAAFSLDQAINQMVKEEGAT